MQDLSHCTPRVLVRDMRIDLHDLRVDVPDPFLHQWRRSARDQRLADEAMPKRVQVARQVDFLENPFYVSSGSPGIDLSVGDRTTRRCPR